MICRVFAVEIANNKVNSRIAFSYAISWQLFHIKQFH